MRGSREIPAILAFSPIAGMSARPRIENGASEMCRAGADGPRNAQPVDEKLVAELRKRMEGYTGPPVNKGGVR